MMLRVLLLSCVLASALPVYVAEPSSPREQSESASQPLPPRWYVISPHGENFTYQTTGIPKLYVQHPEDDSGMYEIGGAKVSRQYTYHAYYDGVVYLVHVYKTLSPEKLLKALTDGPPLKGVSARDVEANGVRAKEYDTSSDNLYRKSRFITSGNFLYELETAARDKGSPACDKFLNSFTPGKPNLSSANEISPVRGTSEVSNGQSPSSAQASSAVPGGSAEQLMTSKEVTRKAAVLYKPEPLYTEEARQKQITGTISIRLVLASDGNATNVTVERGLPGGLNDTAVAAARAIRFLPAEKDGHRVSQYARIDYNYNIY